VRCEEEEGEEEEEEEEEEKERTIKKKIHTPNTAQKKRTKIKRLHNFFAVCYI
jgi:hypothetical protein